MATQNNFTRSFQTNDAASRGMVAAISPNGKVSVALCDSATAIGIFQEDTTSGAYENPVIRLPGTGTVMVSVTGTPLTAGDLMVIVTGGQVSVTNGRAGNSGVAIGLLIESAGPSTNGTLREVAMRF